MRIKLIGSTQEPADGQMDIKAPRESELPSDLFMIVVAVLKQKENNFL
jgi:hypothetical protein